MSHHCCTISPFFLYMTYSVLLFMIFFIHIGDNIETLGKGQTRDAAVFLDFKAISKFQQFLDFKIKIVTLVFSIFQKHVF